MKIPPLLPFSKGGISARAQGISAAEIIRRAIDKLIRRGIHNLKLSERQNLYAALLNRTQGIWQKGDGLENQEKSRAEWGDA
jgi:hypothetical protein